MPIAHVARALAFAGVIVAAVVVVVALPRAWQLGSEALQGPLTQQRAAVLAGVADRQVVQTKDGYVAMRVRTEAAGRMVELILVSEAEPEPQVSVLTQAPVAAVDVRPDSSVIWAEAISCRPERQIRQPNMVFGWSQPPPSQLSVSVPGSATEFDGYFLFVLEDAQLNDGQWVELKLGSFEDRRPSNLFARTDRCTGEPPVGH